MRRAPLLAAASLAALCFAGCRPVRKARFPRWRDRLARFAEIEKLAVAPLRDESGKLGRYEDVFSRLLADEIVPYKRFKMIYPKQLAAAAEQANLELVKRANSEGRTPDEDKRIKLGRSALDAVHAARAAGADAVLVVTAHTFKIYPPKRLAVTYRVYACAAPHRSFDNIRRMTDAGVPQDISGPLRDKFIWERQEHYDTERKGTRLDMYLHSRKHEKTRAFGSEIFYYSTEKFLAFVSARLAGRLYRDSLWYRSNAGRNVARKHGLHRGKLASGGSSGSGFEPGHGERGTERR